MNKKTAMSEVTAMTMASVMNAAVVVTVKDGDRCGDGGSCWLNKQL